MTMMLMVIGGALMVLGGWLILSGLQAGWYSRPSVTARDLLTDPDRIIRQYTRSPVMRQHIAFTEARTDWLAEHEARGELDQATAELAGVRRAMGTLPAGEYEVHVQEQPTPVMVTWTPYDQARAAFVQSGSPSAKEAMLSHVRLPSDPNCTYPGCGGSGTVWDGDKLVKCPRCG